MSSRVVKIDDTGLGVSLIASAVIHMAVFLLLALSGGLLPPQMVIQETYYVDIVTLPVASPQSGTSAQSPSNSQTAPPPPALPPLMTAPSRTKVAPKAVAKATDTPTAKPTTEQDTAETESAFSDRIAKLESSREARREEAVLEKLRSKVKTGMNSKVGTPGGSGAEAGSRYADYVKARLEDALKITSSYTSKSPEVAVRLTITAEGKLSRLKIERSSGDATFELAVRRAIDLASEKFTPPPNHATFENGFVFKPKGISNGATH